MDGNGRWAKHRGLPRLAGHHAGTENLGRITIARAVQRVLATGVRPEEVTEDLIDRHLDTAGLPDLDLVIRTGGEMRLSNFLLWQAAYAEYYSTPICWPDFGREELYQAFAEFG